MKNIINNFLLYLGLIAITIGCLSAQTASQQKPSNSAELAQNFELNNERDVFTEDYIFEEEYEMLKALEKFKSRLSRHPPSLGEARNELDKILQDLPKDREPSKAFITDLQDFFFIFMNVYMDEWLGEGRLIFGNPADYWIYFKTEKKFFDISNFSFKRVIKYKITSTPPADSSLRELGRFQQPTIENACISLLDDEGFEIQLIKAGTLTDRYSTRGAFEISEKDYKKIREIYFSNKQG